MHALLQDLRLALRMLAGSPASTVVAILTLALVIGANTVIFSAVNTVLLRPLPFTDPDRLYVVAEVGPDRQGLPVSYLDWLDYRAGATAFAGLAAVGRMPVDLTGDGEPERLIADLYSHETLTVLDVEPALGRNFLPEEDRANGPKAVILSHSLWVRRFAADPAILGRTIVLDRAAWTVVGVMREGYAFAFAGTDIIQPLGHRADTPLFRDRNSRAGIFLVGRLKPGVTAEQADADVQAVGAAIAARDPDDLATCRPVVGSLREGVVELHRPGLLLLMGAVFCVLLIAVANVANLMLARVMTRARELDIRAALGAGRWRLIRALLVESVLLALAGGGLGLLLARWGVDLLTAVRPHVGAAMFGPITVDATVLGFTGVVALGTGLLFGLVPAIHASRQDLAQALKGADLHATGGGRHLRARSVLVVSEVALALALLVAAVLAVRGLVRVQTLDPGFALDGLLHARITQPATRFATADELRGFWADVRRRIAAVPGVTAVSITGGAPLVGSHQDLVSADGEPLGLASSRVAAAYVGDEHLIATLQVPLLAGRTFGPQDSAETRPVLILNKTLADELFPGQDPIGRRVHDRLSELPDIEVVGVVGDVLHHAPMGLATSRYQLYYAMAQLPEAVKPLLENMAVVVRGQADPHAVVPQLRAAVAEIDPDLPVHSVVTFSDVFAGGLASRRYTTALLGVFAGLAFMLAAVGLYAVMASTVAQRTHELGVRMALGARPGSVVALVVRQGMALVAIGSGAGVLGTVGLTHTMASALSDEISATDPLTYLGVTALLVSVGLLATYIAARRVSRIDPMLALRSA